MLNHEWMRQRERRIRQGQREPSPAAEEGAQPVADEVAAEPLATPELVPIASSEAGTDAAVGPDSVSESTPEAGPNPEPAPAASAPAQPEPPPPAASRPAPDPREVVERLDVPVVSLRERLSSVLAHQAQLPLDIEARRAVSDGVEGSPRETREALVQRLLDPTLTLEEVSLLLGVCRTTVRRYTDRGVLRCFRTPGNQRRFHLTDVLDFMERQARGQA